MSLTTPAAGELVLSAETLTRIRLALTRLGRRVRQHAGPGITPSQQSVLFSIERRGPVTLGALASLEGVQPPSITRCVGLLEGKGLVTREPGEEDRRLTRVRLSDEGHALLAEVRQQRNVWLASLAAQLTPAEQAQLAAALPALERLVELSS